MSDNSARSEQPCGLDSRRSDHPTGVVASDLAQPTSVVLEPAGRREVCLCAGCQEDDGLMSEQSSNEQLSNELLSDEVLGEDDASLAEPSPQGDQSELDLGVVDTGDAAVDQALSGLDQLKVLPVSEHPQVFGDVHQGLSRAMTRAGEEPSADHALVSDTDSEPAKSVEGHGSEH